MKTYKDTIYDQYQKEQAMIRIAPYVEAVCNYYACDVNTLINGTSQREIVTKRYIIYYLLKSNWEKNKVTWGQMADYFGDDHTTAIHGVGKVRELITVIGVNGHARVPDPVLKNDIEIITAYLKSL